MKGRRVTQQCGGFTGHLKDAGDDGGHCNGLLCSLVRQLISHSLAFDVVHVSEIKNKNGGMAL